MASTPSAVARRFRKKCEMDDTAGRKITPQAIPQARPWATKIVAYEVANDSPKIPPAAERRSSESQRAWREASVQLD